MTLRHAALSSLFILMAAACSSAGSEPGNGRGGTGGTNSSGGSGGSGKGGSGGSSTGGSGGSSTGGSGTGGATGGTGGAGTGGTTGTGGSGGTTGSGGAAGTGGAGTGGAAGSGGAGTGSGGTAGAGAGGTATGGAAGAGGAGTAGTGGAPDAGSKGGTAGTGGSSGTAGKDGGTGGSTVDAAPPPPTDGGPPDIPTPMGPCPDFAQGDLNFVTKTGMRKAAVSMSSVASTISGPLIFYWYETTGNPTRVNNGLPVSTITAAGGVIVAPYDSYPTDAFPWIGHYTDHDALFDEVLGCAVQKTKINPGRVHALGFSAGAMMTTHLSFARSKYLASVAAYSGGGNGQFQEMNNKFPAMIINGGTGDIFGGTTNFYTMSQTWQTTLKNAGHFAMFCDHGGGHTLPNATIRGGVYQFFVDHPYGTNPSPYSGGKIPSAISICRE
jgi:hypothetical protein